MCMSVSCETVSATESDRGTGVARSVRRGLAGRWCGEARPVARAVRLSGCVMRKIGRGAPGRRARRVLSLLHPGASSTLLFAGCKFGSSGRTELTSERRSDETSASFDDCEFCFQLRPDARVLSAPWSLIKWSAFVCSSCKFKRGH